MSEKHNEDSHMTKEHKGPKSEGSPERRRTKTYYKENKNKKGTSGSEPEYLQGRNSPKRGTLGVHTEWE